MLHTNHESISNNIETRHDHELSSSPHTQQANIVDIHHSSQTSEPSSEEEFSDCLVCKTFHPKKDFEKNFYISLPYLIDEQPSVVVDDSGRKEDTPDENARQQQHTELASDSTRLLSWESLEKAFHPNIVEVILNNNIQTQSTFRVCDKMAEFMIVYSDLLSGEENDGNEIQDNVLAMENEIHPGDNVNSETDIELTSITEDSEEKSLVKLFNNFSDKLMGDITKEFIQKPSVKQVTIDIFKIVLSFMAMMSVILIGSIGIMFIEQSNELQIYMEQHNITTPIDPFNSNITFRWNYGNSVYFTIVTLTTIGYGDMTPSTIGGKLYVVFVGFLGIALMGLWISFVGGAIMNSFGAGGFVVLLYVKRSLALCCGCCKNRDLKSSLKGSKEMITNPELTRFEKRLYSFFNRGVTQIINIILLLGAYVVAVAAIFSYLEGWEYYDAFYYSFITLSTVGFGDLYPKTVGGKVLFGCFALIGLGLLGILLGLVGKSIQESVISQFKKAQKKTFLEFKDLQEKAAMKQLGNIMNKQKETMSHGLQFLKKGGKGGLNLLKEGGKGGFNKLKQGGTGGLNFLKEGGKGGLQMIKSGGAGGINLIKEGKGSINMIKDKLTNKYL
ncbi:hypothetical protein C9374_006997 [Naegleria lovaniensis]|uniref:Potassium channel domain-containing protein n=1 Tax=Naegleria lovaniensis TaxID=51637 RepID=A0AA88H438_NAELO|nr:uncharacterized protein C9374_006997 [Naegleria lovaniensis]KAG2393466.1 hypothetical protein C9374_006997 [Naegleria lovaniensis]